MTVFACIISFMLGWIAFKGTDIYDRKREREESEKIDDEDMAEIRLL